MVLRDVLIEMKKMDGKKPVPFSIVYRTYNQQNGFGGKIKRYPKATLMQAPQKKGLKRLADKTPFKNPNHFKNRTRNISTPEGERKFNILFIIEFNGYKVIY